MNKQKILITIIVIYSFLIQNNSLNAKPRTEINNYINNLNLGNENLIIIAMDIEDCFSCNLPKINGIYNNLKATISNSKTIIVIESKIPKDSYAMKNAFDTDLFFEDTLFIFSKNNLIFPNILIRDNFNNFINLNFNQLISNSTNINKLINPQNYEILKRIAIKETDDYIFTSPISPIISNGNLLFLAKLRNQILNYNFDNEEISEYFTPKIDDIYKYSNINSDSLDLFLSDGTPGINFLFQILNFQFENNKTVLLIDKLSMLNIDFDNKEISIDLNKGLFTIEDNINSFREFKSINYVKYDDFSLNQKNKLIKIKYGSDYRTKDSLALILNIGEDYVFDTLITVKDLKLKMYEYKYEINELVDFLGIAEGNKFFLLSKKCKKYTSIKIKS